MSLLGKAKFLLREYRILPNRFMGQNFMIDSTIFQNLSDYASLGKTDVVLEIGSGLGFLTSFIAERCAKVLAIEVDNKLAGILHDQVQRMPNVEVLQGNVFDLAIPKFTKIVSLPPYQISTRLLTWLFDRKFDCAVLALQKEFAGRLVAGVGSEDYSWLTVLTYCHLECELLDEIEKCAFYPQPKVNSIIVRFFPKKLSPFNVKNKDLFMKLVKFLFKQRNRKVKNALLPFLTCVAAKTLEEANNIAKIIPFSDRRARELTPEDFGVIANALV